MSEDIMHLFSEAISRALRPWSVSEKEEVLRKVSGVLKQLGEGKVSEEDAYYQLVGIAYEHIVPLSPGDLARLKELLRKARVVTVV